MEEKSFDSFVLSIWFFNMLIHIEIHILWIPLCLNMNLDSHTFDSHLDSCSFASSVDSRSRSIHISGSRSIHATVYV